MGCLDGISRRMLDHVTGEDVLVCVCRSRGKDGAMTTIEQDAPGLSACRVLERAVAHGEIPGAVAMVVHHGKILLQRAFGSAALEPIQRPMQIDTRFDLASLTKPLATTAVVLALADRGELALDDPISRYLPQFSALHGVTVRRLLTHSSGLPGWRPTYTWGSGRDAILAGLSALSLVYAPGRHVQYSCLGFMTLGLLVEHLSAQPLDQLAEELIFSPMGLTDIGFAGPGLPEALCASTERGNAFERAMVERADHVFLDWRTDFYSGQVNDGNAYYGLGGVSGNAGLFGSAVAVSALGEMWLNGGRYRNVQVLSGAAVRLATTNQTPGLDAPRGLGWQLTALTPPTAEELSIPPSNTDYFPPAWFDDPWAARPGGEYLSSHAFGHTGFTGTSIWIDPGADLVITLLTNSIHPSVRHEAGLPSLRARFHNTLVASLVRASIQGT